jgi:hypothetical protein
LEAYFGISEVVAMCHSRGKEVTQRWSAGTGDVIAKLDEESDGF